MRVLVPFDAADPKTRLAPVLAETERREFAQRMLADVLEAVSTVDPDPAVIATAPIDLARGTVTVDDRPLTVIVDEAITETVSAGEPLAVVMADLALLTPAALDRLLTPDADVVVAPGRGVGTNALVVRTPAFGVDFHGASYLDHCEAATRAGATLETVDSFRLSTDVDEPADLVEAFVHGASETTTWLESRFRLAVSGEGRVSLERR